MFAVEFRTTVRNGVVVIPVEHRDRFEGNVKVVLMVEDASQPSTNMIDELLSNPLCVPGFKPLTRDEVHAR